jgi:hypothetical protein
MLYFTPSGTLLETIIVVVCFIGLILFCLWSFKGPNPHYRVARTQPSPDRIEGHGYVKGIEYSYSHETHNSRPDDASNERT